MYKEEKLQKTISKSAKRVTNALEKSFTANSVTSTSIYGGKLQDKLVVHIRAKTDLGDTHLTSRI